MVKKIDFSKVIKLLNEIAEPIRRLVRAKSGLPLEESEFSGLVDVRDLRERTRITYHDVLRHSFMLLIANEGGDEWGIFKEIADMEDHYFISLDGEQRREMILAKTRHETMQITATEPSLSLPQVSTRKKLSEPVSVETKK